VGLDEVARQLYAAPPGEFVATRDEHARQAREAGDRRLADALRKLRRPTQSAWLVNLLVQEWPELVEDLLTVGAGFRGERLTRQRLLELTERRRELLHRLQAEAQRFSAEAGLALTAERAREVEATLAAAVADPDAAEQVRGGRLATALSYSGLGPELQFAQEPRTAAPEPTSVVSAPPGSAAADASTTGGRDQARHGGPPPAEARRAAERERVERLVAERSEAWQDAVRQRDVLVRQRQELRTELERVQQRLNRIERDLETAQQDVEISVNELNLAKAQATHDDRDG